MEKAESEKQSVHMQMDQKGHVMTLCLREKDPFLTHI